MQARISAVPRSTLQTFFADRIECVILCYKSATQPAAPRRSRYQRFFSMPLRHISGILRSTSEHQQQAPLAAGSLRAIESLHGFTFASPFGSDLDVLAPSRLSNRERQQYLLSIAVKKHSRERSSSRTALTPATQFQAFEDLLHYAKREQVHCMPTIPNQKANGNQKHQNCRLLAARLLPKAARLHGPTISN